MNHIHKASIRRCKPLTYNLPMDVLKTWEGTIHQIQQLPDGTWTEVELGKNQVLLPGLQALAMAIYKKPSVVTFEKFEDELYKPVTASISTNNMTVMDEKSQIKVVEGDKNVPYLQGYNVCFDGGQGDGVRPYQRHKKGYDFDTLIPFRMIPKTSNNYDVMRTKYLHSREVTLDGKEYVQYFTKKISLTYKCQLDDGTTVPHNPDTNLTTDRDSRVLAEFTVSVQPDECKEYFTLLKKGGAKSTMYNSVITMFGKEAKHTINGTAYDSMIDTVVFSKCNHVPVPHGVDGDIICKYRTMHI